MEDEKLKLAEKAYKLHTAGRLKEAEALYETLLKNDRNNLNVLNLYAQLKYVLKDYDAALKAFYEVYEKTKLEDIKINIVKVYFQKKDFESALKVLNSIPARTDEVLRMEAQIYSAVKKFNSAAAAYSRINKPSLSDKFNLSIAYLNTDRLEDALKCALEVYNQNKNDADICLHTAGIYSRMNNKEKQLEYSLKASEISPDKDLFLSIGVLCRQTGDDEKAAEYFNKVLEIEPLNKQALLNIASLYKNYDKNISLEIYKELLIKYPGDIDILTQLYILYTNMFNWDGACGAALKIIEISPETDYAYSLAGTALYNLGRYDEALDMFQKASEFENIDKDYVYSSIASIYSVLQQDDKAVQIYKTYLPHKMNNDEGYAYVQLRGKNLEEGREAMYAHLSRLRTEEELEERALKLFYKLNIDKKYGVNEHTFKQFKDNSANIKLERYKHYLEKTAYKQNFDGSRFLVYHASGFGDLIMFSRYIKILENHTNKIILQVPQSMKRIISYNYPECRIVLDDFTVSDSEYDYSSSFFNLLCCLPELDLNNIPFSEGYLSLNKELIQEKAALDIMKTDKKKIGIFYQGNPNILAQRSVKLKYLKPLFEMPDTQIYSLQISKIDFESEELRNQLPMIDLAPHIKDWADTAAFLENLDLLITIDSGIANLAGALGVNTILMLPFETEWRWFHDTKKTPWYDSIRIFKQTNPGDWDSIAERIKNESAV